MIKGKQRESVERKIYTGCEDVKPVMVNPNQSQLSEFLGTENVKEPEYSDTDKHGNKRIRLDIWVESEHVKTKIPIWISNTPFMSNDGTKQEFLNIVGQTTWAPDLKSAIANAQSWYRTEKLRPSMRGESQLYAFLLAWSDIDIKDPGSEVLLETSIADIIEGDVYELNKLCTTLKNKVRVLLGVSDDQYQDVYTRCFLAEGSTNYRRLREELKYPWSSYYQNSFILKEYVPGEASPETESQATDSEVDKYMKSL